jgi:hypothetical protein
MSKSERNEIVKNYMTDKLDQAEKASSADFLNLSEYEKADRILTDLIEVKALGFRGVVATAIAGMYINPNYDPLNDFYSCNPRSLFEGAIYYSFSGRVPCGKSDPLNVAKNQSVLDEAWTKGKRPEYAAQGAVDFLRMLTASAKNREQLIDFYFYRLLSYTQKSTSILINIPDSNRASKLELGRRLVRFSLEYPESGTTPQKVIALLLMATFDGTGSKVQGEHESVFGTNTTSKKPADLWVESENSVTSLFEVTVKKVDEKRLEDAISHIYNLELIDNPLTFICRIPEDIRGLDSIEIGDRCATYKFKGKDIDFCDISSFIVSLSAAISDLAMQTMLEKLSKFVNQIERPITTKNGWNSIFES